MIDNVDHLPGDLTAPLFGPRMVCTKCGTLAPTCGRIGRSSLPEKASQASSGAINEPATEETGAGAGSRIKSAGKGFARARDRADP